MADINAHELKEQIRAQGLALGFDQVGFAPAIIDAKNQTALDAFLKAGRQGTMDWLANNQDRRSDPKELMPGTRTVIVCTANYGPGTDPMSLADATDRGRVSCYAQGKDYHDVLKKHLKKLARWLVEAAKDAEPDVRVFVDTAPVLEKPLAQAAGLGWQGKHTNLVSRDFGSWLFLGEVFLNLELPPDPPEIDHCGTCDACLRSCPTDAFPAPYELDARACISYLTIEHKGDIAEDLMERMGNHIYGCDDCLAACPWTKFSSPTSEAAFHPRAELTAPRLADLAQLDDAGFRALFSGSPIKRTGRDRFVRNVAIAIGNSGDTALLPTAESLARDEAEVVATAGTWAARRLAQSAEAS